MDEINASDSSTIKLTEPSKQEFKVFKRRWLVLAALFGLGLCQTITSICISALTSEIATAYDVPLSEVDLAVSISAALFLPAFIVSTLLYNRYESKTVLSISAVVMFIGAWVRLITKMSDNFWWVVIGQGIIACVGPFVNSAISIIVNNWFAD